MANPFLIFPEEVWEPILKRIFEYEDVCNLFKVFPLLELRFQRLKPLWILDKVLPLLTERNQFISEPSLLNLRLVCKHFRIGVDTYLKTQPNLIPFSSAVSLPNYDSLSSAFPTPTYFCGVVLNSQTYLSHPLFLNLFSNPPKASNFIPSALKFKAYDLQTNSRVWMNLRNIIRASSPNLQFLSIRYRVSQTEQLHLLDFWRWLEDLLPLIPNITSLTINHSSPVAELLPECTDILQLWTVKLPNLPHLECLESSHPILPQEIINPFVSKYSHQLKKLTIPIQSFQKSYKIFPNLTELSLRYVQNGDELKRLLKYLNAPNLLKIKLWLASLDTLFDPSGYVVMSIDELIKWLQPFPKLACLEISNEYHTRIVERCILQPEVNKLQNLTFLKIQDGYFQYDFLKCFPKLEFLQIYSGFYCNCEKCWNFTQTEMGGEEMQNVYKSSVWNILSRLKVLTLVVRNTFIRRQYFRERWEYFRKDNMNNNGFDLCDVLVHNYCGSGRTVSRRERVVDAFNLQKRGCNCT